MINKKLASMFSEIADVLQLEGVQWKPRAYRKAARTLESEERDVSDIYDQGGLKALKELPAIGDAIAKKIEEYIKTGEMTAYKKYLSQIPEGLDDLMEIGGLGPKKVMKLHKELGINTIEDLEEAVENKKIREVEGFGEKSEQDIQRGIEMFKRGQDRFRLGDALPIAHEVYDELKQLDVVQKIHIAGSLRRWKETIGDVDILVLSDKPKTVMDHFTNMEAVQHVLAKGDTKSSVHLLKNIQADLRIVEQKSYGAALQYFTGSKEHNVKLREIAIKQNYKLSEYGLFKKDSEQYVCGETEEEIYEQLGMQFIAPELREQRGEISAAQENTLPDLVTVEDIKGDLQSHSDWSDGMHSIKEMAQQADAMGYEYLALTDHSPRTAIAQGPSADELKEKWEEIDKVQKEVDVKLLKTAEVDILKDGSLDYPDDVLKQMDMVLVSVHSGFKMSEKEMTDRILKALQHPAVNILAHPTGRKVLKREPYNVDLEKVFKAAKQNKVALEINASPSRLDLKDIHVKAAIEAGVKISLGTDAHRKENLTFMEYGVATARRGWCTKKDILNCLSYKQLITHFGSG